MSSIEGLKPVELHIRNADSSVTRLTTQAKFMRFIKLHYHPYLPASPIARSQTTDVGARVLNLLS